LLVVLLLISPVLYLLFWPVVGRPAETEPTGPRISNRWLVLSFSAFLLLAFAPLVELTQIQTAVVNARLFLASHYINTVFAYGSKANRVTTQLDKVQSIVEFSQKNHLDTDLRLTERLQSQVERGLDQKHIAEAARPAAWRTVVSLAKYNTFEAAPSRTLALGPQSGAGDAQHYLRNTDSRGVTRIVGHDTNLLMVGSGIFTVGKTPTVFTGVNFIGIARVGVPLLIEGSTTNTLVENSRLIYVTQPLDYAIWSNVQFESSVIVYLGGPVFMENVIFKNCTLQFRPGAATDELSQAIRKANGKALTYANPGTG
jgi:hypothetical protein